MSAPATPATVARPPRGAAPAGPAGAGDLAGWLAGATAVAALTETALLRLATRTAIHIPGIERIATPYGIFATAGRFAHYAASVLVAVTLALLARLLVRRARPREAAAAGLVLAAWAGARAGLVTDVALAVAIGVAVAALVAAAVRTRPGCRVPVALFGVAFLASVAHAVTQHLSGAGALRPAGTTWLLVAAETLALAAVAMLPWAVPAVGTGSAGALRRSDLAVGATVAALLAGAFAAAAATSTILLLWTFGLAGYFPAAMYAVAAGLLVAVLRALGRGHRDLMVSLALVALGGIGLHSSYQSALVVCGLALLAAAPARVRR